MPHQHAGRANLERRLAIVPWEDENARRHIRGIFERLRRSRLAPPGFCTSIRPRLRVAVMFLSYLSLVILLLGLTLVFYGFIWVHDLPYAIAKKRHHPQAEAIHVACWLSLFTLH